MKGPGKYSIAIYFVVFLGAYYIKTIDYSPYALVLCLQQTKVRLIV